MEPHISVEIQQETGATAGQYNLCRVLVGGEGERQVARSRPRPRARTEWGKMRYKKYNSLSITSFMLGLNSITVQPEILAVYKFGSLAPNQLGLNNILILYFMIKFS